MRELEFKVLKNQRIARDVYLLEMDGDCRDFTAPGQFVNIALPGFYLRRPISVYDWDAQCLRLIYKVLGRGTEALSYVEKGEYLRLLLPLGNGFSVERALAHERLVLAGGGVGVPPLYGLARALLAAGRKAEVVLGFQSADDVFAREAFEALGLNVSVATADGSMGVQGLITSLIPADAYVMACGPEPMLRAVHALVKSGQFSFEARMACGFGGCMGCSCQTKYGSKRICKEGPVLDWEEIVW